MAWYDKFIEFLFGSKQKAKEISSIASSKIGTVVDSLVNKYSGAGLTGADKESIDVQGQMNDWLAQQSYERNVDFFEKYQSYPAQVSQMKSAGLNPALMYGSGAGVSASTPSSAGSVSGGVSSSPDILGLLLNVAIRSKQMDQDKSLRRYDQLLEYRKVRVQEDYNRILEERLGHQNSESDALSLFYSAQRERLLALYPSEKESLEASTKVALDSLKTAEVKRKLDEQNISESMAREALTWRENVLKTTQAKYADEYYRLSNEYLRLSNALLDAERVGQQLENRFLRETLENRIKTIEYQMNDALYQAAIHSKDFSTYGQKNAREWVDTVSGAVRAVGAGVGSVIGFKGLGNLSRLNTPGSIITGAGPSFGFGNYTVPYGMLRQ